MRQVITGIVLLLTMQLHAQDTLEYLHVLEMTTQHSPRFADSELIGRQGELTLENVSRNWYPELMLNGKASYQSDVVSIEIDQPGFTFSFPEMPHQQFGVNLDIRQHIYDGGFSRQKKVVEELSTDVALKKVEVDLHELKQKVSDLYFSALLLQENRRNMEVALENLRLREKVITSSVEHGVAEKADLQLIRVEILKIRQSLSEIDAAREGLVGMLGIYTGEVKDHAEILTVPSLEIAADSGILRPELALIDLQKRHIDAGRDLQTVKRMPRLFAFGQAGVGMPGYNLLNDKVDTYYMVGAGIQWNIWDWSMIAREKQKLEIQEQIVSHSGESLTRGIEAAMQKELKNVKHYREAIELDRDMVEIRIEITRNAASKLENGVINASEYLRIFNDEHMARIRMTTDSIRYARSMATYNLLIGNL